MDLEYIQIIADDVTYSKSLLHHKIKYNYQQFQMYFFKELAFTQNFPHIKMAFVTNAYKCSISLSHYVNCYCSDDVTKSRASATDLCHCCIMRHDQECYDLTMWWTKVTVLFSLQNLAKSFCTLQMDIYDP